MSIAFRKLCEDSEISDRKEMRALARETTRIVCRDDSLAKQSFADECDLNKILEKASRTGMVSHLSRYGEMYGDLAGVDLQEMMNTVARANTMFAELPAEVRREFGNNQQAFFDFVNDPANKDKLKERLPALARSGNQLPQVDRTKGPIELGAGSSPKDSPAPQASKSASGATEAPAEPAPSEHS